MSCLRVSCVAVNITAVWSSMLTKCAKGNGDFLNATLQDTEQVILYCYTEFDFNTTEYCYVIRMPTTCRLGEKLCWYITINLSNG